MKILYVTNHRFPTEKAHGLQIAKMCEAFLEAGAGLELVVPRRIQSKYVKTKSAKRFYSLRRDIPVRWLWSFDSRFLRRLHLGLLVYFAQSFSFFVSFLFMKKGGDVLFSRGLIPFWARGGLPYFYEAHTFPKTALGRMVHKVVLRNAAGVICISEGLEKKFKNLVKVPLLVAHDGVDLSLFKGRAKANAKPVILYLGSPYEWKGVYTLAEAAKGLDAELRFVGGNADEEEFKSLKATAVGAVVRPYVPYKKVPAELAAADVLVIPNSAKDSIGREDTSPLKVFEYMATGKKIVSSDVPALKAILNEKCAWFFKADDAADLKRVLKLALKGGAAKGVAAKKAAEGHSWAKRAERLLEFIAAAV